MSIVNTLSLESNRQIKLNFDGGDLSSDAGLLLIKEFAAKIGFTKLIKNKFKTKNLMGSGTKYIECTTEVFCFLCTTFHFSVVHQQQVSLPMHYIIPSTFDRRLVTRLSFL